MNTRQFQQELEYGAALSIAKAMLRLRLITPEEYRKVHTALVKKHRPIISGMLEQSSDDPIPDTSKKMKGGPV